MPTALEYLRGEVDLKPNRIRKNSKHHVWVNKLNKYTENHTEKRNI